MEAVWEVFDNRRLRVADRGLREGLLLSMMHGERPPRRRRPKRSKRTGTEGGAANVG
jgi:exopolyphosphatase/guanosine-5'-triphosphate,3'-diphosphate pyrophosphatase